MSGLCSICDTNHRDVQDHPFQEKNKHAVALGRKGGQSKSKKKAAASRKNGKLAGKKSG